MFAHIDRIMHGDFRAEPDLAERPAAPNLARQGPRNVERALGVVEEIIIGAEEVVNSKRAGDLSNFLRDALAALRPELRLVVSGNRAIRTTKLAAGGHDDAGDRAVLRTRSAGNAWLASVIPLLGASSSL